MPTLAKQMNEIQLWRSVENNSCPLKLSKILFCSAQRHGVVDESILTSLRVHGKSFASFRVACSRGRLEAKRGDGPVRAPLRGDLAHRARNVYNVDTKIIIL